MKQNEMIEAIAATVVDWDIDNLISFVQDEIRLKLCCLDIEEVKREYESVFGVQPQEDEEVKT